MSRKKLIVIILFLLTAIFLFLQPSHFLEPDEWAYYFSAQNFSRGEYKITEEKYRRLQAAAKESAAEIGGSHFTQYRKMPDGTRVTEKPPGYILLLAFFTLLGAPLLLNVLAAAAALASLYYFCSRIFDEDTAFLASILFLFTPISLIFYYRIYLADFAACCLLTSGLLLSLIPLNEEKNGGANRPCLFFLLGGTALGISLLIRFFNFIPVIPLVCVLVFRWIRFWRGKNRISIVKEILSFAPGIFLFLSVLLFNNLWMFGSVLTLWYITTGCSDRSGRWGTRPAPRPSSGPAKAMPFSSSF